MKLVVGLGNPGKEYAKTRHNVGFMVLDYFAKEQGVSIEQNKFKGLIGECRIGFEKVILLKPQTYMNLSGESIRSIVDFYNIAIEDIIVVYDDLDLPCGKLRLRANGSSGGQNGVKSIISHLGTQEFNRIRVGIDKNPQIKTADYVLGKFSEEQQNLVNEALVQANDAILCFIKDDFNKAMNLYNKK